MTDKKEKKEKKGGKLPRKGYLEDLNDTLKDLVKKREEKRKKKKD
jgi:hypothetical protein